MVAGTKLSSFKRKRTPHCQRISAGHWNVGNLKLITSICVCDTLNSVQIWYIFAGSKGDTDPKPLAHLCCRVCFPCGTQQGGLHSFLSHFSCIQPGLIANIQGKTRHLAGWGGQFAVMIDLTNLTLHWQICSTSVKHAGVWGWFCCSLFLKYWRYLLSEWGYGSRYTVLNLHGNCGRFLTQLLTRMQ